MPDEVDMPAFSARIWLNREKTEWEDVWPGYRLQIHRIPADPEPDIPNYYLATVKAIIRVSGENILVLEDHDRRNTQTKYTEPNELLGLKSEDIVKFAIVSRTRKKVIGPLPTAREVMEMRKKTA